jgi:hypothetical protein
VNIVSLSFVGMVIPYHIGLTIFQRIQDNFLTPLNKVIHRGARLLFSCYFPSLHLAVSKYSLSFFLYLNPSMNPMTGKNNKLDKNNRNKNFISQIILSCVLVFAYTTFYFCEERLRCSYATQALPSTVQVLL